MPSYKPRITVYTDEETSKKIAYIAKRENRSASNFTEYLIKKAINDYEKENGEIIIEKGEKEDSTAMKVIKLATGVTAGEKLADASIAAGNKAADMFLDAIHKKKDSKD